MAIYPDIPGLRVEVKIDDEAAVEYPADEIEHDEEEGDEIPTVSKYIEAKTGADFYIESNMRTELRSQIELPAGQPHLRFTIRVDGIRKHFRPLSELALEDFRFYRKMRPAPERRQDGSLIERNFTFAEVNSEESTDLERVAQDKAIARGLGLIEVLVCSGSSTGPTHRTLSLKEDFKQEGITIAEKSMKGKEISHCATMRNTGKMAQDERSMTFQKYKNLCRFRFYYRSKAALQKLMIVERTPEPSELDNMTPEQLRELAEEAWRARQNGGVKREADDKDQIRRSITRVKTEHVDLTEEPKWTFPQEPVDLTEDD